MYLEYNKLQQRCHDDIQHYFEHIYLAKTVLLIHNLVMM